MFSSCDSSSTSATQHVSFEEQYKVPSNVAQYTSSGGGVKQKVFCKKVLIRSARIAGPANYGLQLILAAVAGIGRCS